MIIDSWGTIGNKNILISSIVLFSLLVSECESYDPSRQDKDFVNHEAICYYEFDKEKQLKVRKGMPVRVSYFSRVDYVQNNFMHTIGSS